MEVVVPTLCGACHKNWGNPWDYEDANFNVLADNQKVDPSAQCASIASFLCEVARE